MKLWLLALLVGLGLLVTWSVWPMLAGSLPDESIDWRKPDIDALSPEEITFQSDGLKMSGLVFSPAEPRAVAVIVHGSGTSDRTNPFYLQLTEALVGKDIAVLLPDKRGSGHSEGDWRVASFEELADDSIAALGRARAIWPDLPVSFVGMSQGSRVAPLAVARGARPDRLVAISGSVVPAFDQLTYEETNTLIGFGLRPAVAEVIAPISAWSIRELRQKRFWDRVGNIDSLDAWREVDVQSLVLFGTSDANVPVEPSIRALQSLDAANIEIAIFQGLGHSLATAEERGISSSPLRAITDFLSSDRPPGADFVAPNEEPAVVP